MGGIWGLRQWIQTSRNFAGGAWELSIPYHIEKNTKRECNFHEDFIESRYPTTYETLRTKWSWWVMRNLNHAYLRSSILRLSLNASMDSQTLKATLIFYVDVWGGTRRNGSLFLMCNLLRCQWKRSLVGRTTPTSRCVVKAAALSAKNLQEVFLWLLQTNCLCSFFKCSFISDKVLKLASQSTNP